VGIIASRITLRDARRSEDEELVAIVENDACGVDAIQAATGCTFGKGNLIFNDYGKSVYTFFNRATGKGLRISLKPGVFESEKGNRSRALFAKVRNDTATNEEREEFERLHLEQTRDMLERGDDMFTTEEVEMKPPEMARLFDSVLCEECGEPTMASRTMEHAGRKLCIPCGERTKGD
jgi:formylmethanofuran dehydrogenase subunit E